MRQKFLQKGFSISGKYSKLFLLNTFFARRIDCSGVMNLAGYIFLGSAAAFGVFCAIWVVFGWTMSGGEGGALVCRCRPGRSELPLIRRYIFLRELGLLRMPLLLLDCTLPEQELAQLRSKCAAIEICSPEALPARLELERNRID